MFFSNGIGLVDIILVLALCAFALWKTGWIRIIVSIPIVIWGVFALSYDMKVGGTLIALGFILFIMATLAKTGRIRSEVADG